MARNHVEIFRKSVLSRFLQEKIHVFATVLLDSQRKSIQRFLYYVEKSVFVPIHLFFEIRILEVWSNFTLSSFSPFRRLRSSSIYLSLRPTVEVKAAMSLFNFFTSSWVISYILETLERSLETDKWSFFKLLISTSISWYFFYQVSFSTCKTWTSFTFILRLLSKLLHRSSKILRSFLPLSHLSSDLINSISVFCNFPDNSFSDALKELIVWSSPLTCYS